MKEINNSRPEIQSLPLVGNFSYAKRLALRFVSCVLAYRVANHFSPDFYTENSQFLVIMGSILFLTLLRDQNQIEKALTNLLRRNNHNIRK